MIIMPDAWENDHGEVHWAGKQVGLRITSVRVFICKCLHVAPTSIS